MPGLMSRGNRRRREREHRLRMRDVLLVQQLLDSGQVRADERAVRDHDRLVAVADVIRVERPLLRRTRLDDEDRLRPFDDGHHESARRPGRSSRRREGRSRAAGPGANSTPPSDCRRPWAWIRSSQPSVIVSRAYARELSGSSGSRTVLSTTIICLLSKSVARSQKSNVELLRVFDRLHLVTF